MKKLMMKMIIIIISIMNKSQELMVKGQKSDGRLQIRCSIQLSPHKEPPEVGLVKKLTGSLY